MTNCPRCDESDVEFIKVEFDGEVIYETAYIEDYSCPSCGTQFQAIYLLSELRIIEDEN